MMWVPCYFYPSEYKKVFELLDNMKRVGYIIEEIDFKRGKARFIKNNCEFVYGLDYSLLYTHKRYFFNEDDERFDMAKLQGWKLQCFDEGVGIWIHEDDIQVMPFYLADEYREIEQGDYKKNVRSLKKWILVLLGLLCLRFVFFIIDRDISFYYQSIFLTFIIVICVWKVNQKELIVDKVFNVLIINYIISKYFSYFSAELAFLLEFATLLVSIDVIRKKSILLKKVQFLNIYRVLVIIIVIYASITYKI